MKSIRNKIINAAYLNDKASSKCEEYLENNLNIFKIFYYDEFLSIYSIRIGVNNFKKFKKL